MEIIYVRQALYAEPRNTRSSPLWKSARRRPGTRTGIWSAVQNLVIGDLVSAETVVMAAYDTPRLRAMGCAVLSRVPRADGRPVAGANRFFRRACRDLLRRS